MAFAGDEFWQYDRNNDPPIDGSYPKSIGEWDWILPMDSIDAAIQWNNQTTYFFKDQKYYIYDHLQVISLLRLNSIIRNYSNSKNSDYEPLM